MTAGKGRAGRIRSNATTASVQAAALDLVRELGPSRVTIDGIATTSGVIKTTIYSRWPNAAAVIMDAFLAGMSAPYCLSTGSTLRETFRNVLRDFARARFVTSRPFAPPDWSDAVGPRTRASSGRSGLARDAKRNAMY